MTNNQYRNALRLAYALERHADQATIKALAQLLNYQPEQLKKDISDLVKTANEIDFEEN